MVNEHWWHQSLQSIMCTLCSGLTNQIGNRKWSSFFFPDPQWSSTVTLEDFSHHQKIWTDKFFSPRKCLFHRSWSPVQARSVTKLKSDFTINSIIFSFLLTDMCAGFQFFKGYFSLWNVMDLPAPEYVKKSGVGFPPILRPAHSWEIGLRTRARGWQNPPACQRWGLWWHLSPSLRPGDC